MLGKDGKPLRGRWHKDGKPMPAGFKWTPSRGSGYSWSLNGEPAEAADDYDASDTMEHLRAQVVDWADVCHALADLAASKPDKGRTKRKPQSRRHKPRTELTEKQQIVWEVRVVARLSFPKIGERMEPPITGEAARRLYKRAKKVMDRRGKSVNPRRRLVE